MDVWTKVWSNCQACSLGCLPLLYLWPTNQRWPPHRQYHSSSATPPLSAAPFSLELPAWLYWEQQIREPSIWVWSPITEGNCQHALGPAGKAGVSGGGGGGRLSPREKQREGAKEWEVDQIGFKTDSGMKTFLAFKAGVPQNYPGSSQLYKYLTTYLHRSASPRLKRSISRGDDWFLNTFYRPSCQKKKKKSVQLVAGPLLSLLTGTGGDSL